MSAALLLPSRSAQRGVALIVVLAVLVLLTILVVGFMSRVSMERTNAAAYAEENRNRNLADQVVSIVRTQIDHASTQPATAWASQPGMIRTFQPDGTLLNAYKLWSDEAMVTPTLDPAAMTETLTRWANAPAHYSDLNEPVTLDGEVHYPIIPASALDTDEDGAPLIQGFELISSTPVSTNPRQPIPMPVRWLYVLEDGTVVAPSGANGERATIAGASRENPIVGRIAFWTDDESAKLNINTASHGQYWDIPRAFSLSERDRMARFQPAFREYQRYPGHPATTSLWPVLGYKSANEASFESFVYALAPRIASGGSMGGTVTATAPITLDDDRLYTSVGELLYSTRFLDAPPPESKRERQPLLTPADVERARFFLSARSNSPEINLFNLPRMAIWPINVDARTPSTLDELIAFCATINDKPYYLQRSDPRSTTNDWKAGRGGNEHVGRNEQLYTYLLALLSKPFPGFGETSFVEKYTVDETRQILTMLFDYIRSSNLYSSQYGATPYSGPGNVTLPGSLTGQAVPLVREETKGFGRIPAIGKAILHFYVSGLRSDEGTYIPETGRAPYYHPPVRGQGADPRYQALANFLQATGEGKEAQLLTSAILYFDLFDPMLGYAYARYGFEIDIEFSGPWTLNDQPLGFENATLTLNRDPYSAYNSKTNTWGNTNYARYWGGHHGPLLLMRNYTSVKGNPPNTFEPSRVYPLASNRLAVHLPIPLVLEDPEDSSSPVTLPNSTTLADQITFSGGSLKATLRHGTEVFQTYELEFPRFTKPAPVYAPRGYIPLRDDLSDTEADVVLKQFATSADFKNRFVSDQIQNQKMLNGVGHLFSNNQPHQANHADVGLVQFHDVIVSLDAAFGDKRLVAARQRVKSGPASDVDAHLVPHPLYSSTSERIATDLRVDGSGGDRSRRAIALGRKPGRILDIPYGANSLPDVSDRYPDGVETTTSGRNNSHFVPDFDNGTLHMPDDAYINRADEGNSYDTVSGTGTSATAARAFAWYTHGWMNEGANIATFFSPNKQMPSAGIFGSLPTGVVRNRPWQTLLFRPDPGNHPGASSPQDYLLLDLFWMPVVEPYAISEPFSTNGKVNLNYQIQPFSYIHRSSALLGVLHKEELLVLENAHARSSGLNAVTQVANDEYKKLSASDSAAAFSQLDYRKRLNLSRTDGTLKAFEDRFAANDLFRSETEICALPLIPEGASWSENFEADYWGNRRLTGDNSREMPYARLLSRLTTRSNTYTVHFRVQSLKKRGSSDPSLWEEGADTVSAEYRGSRTIERYIDPNDPAIPDYATTPSAAPALDAFYRWRTLHNRTFAP